MRPATRWREVKVGRARDLSGLSRAHVWDAPDPRGPPPIDYQEPDGGYGDEWYCEAACGDRAQEGMTLRVDSESVTAVFKAMAAVPLHGTV